MDSHRIGFDELIHIQTDVVSLTIKGQAEHPDFSGAESQENISTIRIQCGDDHTIALRGQDVEGEKKNVVAPRWFIYHTPPIFYEQQRYEILIEGEEGHTIAFWHNNINIRNKVTKASRRYELLSGVINFGNEIGLSDLIVRVDGEDYLKLTIEVFPSKISYQKDYQSIMEDITREVHSIMFDFLKKTYFGYQQHGNAQSSPVEFFAVIQNIYKSLLRAADMLLYQPHHLLETTHQVLPGHKVHRTDKQSIRWIEKHPQYAQRQNERIAVERVMAAKKQVTYDTKENRFTKHILKSIISRLESFRDHYCQMQRNTDEAVIEDINQMIREVNRRCETSFLASVHAQESSSGLSLVFSMAPGYRELYKYYLMLQRGLSITGDVFDISVKDLALLYEYWCFIKLNSLMKDRYQLISQNVIKFQGNGVFVSLVKGLGSTVKYRNPSNGELIVLSYNPKETEVPTVAQRPDNVLALHKHERGSKTQYEYIFDAKYRINPALPGTDYYAHISHEPGPEVSDINTMHRYRDAIVHRSNADPYEQTIFGGYVLFPYADEQRYRTHRFFQSIEKVNIGGLPFLPSATKLVEELLDTLIMDSPETAFERTTLPQGIRKKLAKVDWLKRDVLIGTLRNKEQLAVCLEHKFYHIAAKHVSEGSWPIHYVAIYQSKRLFGAESGIKYYGEVMRCNKLKRNEITEIPKASDEMYYRFEIKEWKELVHPIAAKEDRVFIRYTNMFLLEHCTDMPDLTNIRSAEEYRLYVELKRLASYAALDADASEEGFILNGKTIYISDNNVLVNEGRRIMGRYTVEDFHCKPGAIFRQIRSDIFA